MTEELWSDWLIWLTDNRNHSPIRSLSFEQWAISQLAELKRQMAIVTKLTESPKPVPKPVEKKKE